MPLNLAGLGSTEVLFQRWKDPFDYAYSHAPGGVIAPTVHPQTIERLIEHMAGHDGTWFATLSDSYTWTEG